MRLEASRLVEPDQVVAGEGGAFARYVEVVLAGTGGRRCCGHVDPAGLRSGLDDPVEAPHRQVLRSRSAGEQFVLTGGDARCSCRLQVRRFDDGQGCAVVVSGSTSAHHLEVVSDLLDGRTG